MSLVHVVRNLLEYSVAKKMFLAKTQERKGNALLTNGHWYLNCVQIKRCKSLTTDCTDWLRYFFF
jgi:hypothetical protein